MKPIVRFAPSPTGYLHIGGARTALFNYLFAKHHNGQFLLRIEDTDIERSTESAKQAIIDGLHWLGLQWDGDIFLQSKNLKRHQEVVQELLAKGEAYYCYATPEELAAMREAGHKYDRTWRDRKDEREGVKPSVRIKAPLEGEMIINDAVQGSVRVSCDQLDDMVIMRSDGTPTYMLAVVVDDHDMGITHVIRGDDHLNNAFRQQMIYHAMGWDIPVWAHIPLIHGADGAKLSKRHGAVGIEAYHEMGYLPEALRNYLLRLGWSHGDDEIISDEQAVAWFSNLSDIGKSPARLDFEKMKNVNAHYLRAMNEEELWGLISNICHPSECWDPDLENRNISPLDSSQNKLLLGWNDSSLSRLRQALPLLVQRASTIPEILSAANFLHDEYEFEADLLPKISDNEAKQILRDIISYLQSAAWSDIGVKEAFNNFAQDKGLKAGKFMPLLRICITGTMASPDLIQVLLILGKDETIRRIGKYAA